MTTVEGGVLLVQQHLGKEKIVVARHGQDDALGVFTDNPELVRELLGASLNVYSRKGELHVKHKGLVLYLSEGSPRYALLSGKRTKGFALGKAGLWLACELLDKPLSQNGRAGRIEVQRGAYLAHQYRQRKIEETVGRDAAYRHYRRFIEEAVLVREVIQQELRP